MAILLAFEHSLNRVVDSGTDSYGEFVYANKLKGNFNYIPMKMIILMRMLKMVVMMIMMMMKMRMMIL